jgi:hypothetical protein
MTTAEASNVPTAAKAAPMATVKERLVMSSANVMFLPRMTVGESRGIAPSVNRPSIRVGGVAIAWIVVVAISRCPTSAHPATE